MHRTNRIRIAIVAACMLFIAAQSQAADNKKAERYAGLFVLESNTTNGYWYVDPESHMRYGIRNANDFSRLLTAAGEGIRGKDLKKIVSAENPAAASLTESTRRFRGKLLIEVDADGQAWYVYPLDAKRYKLANGQAGYEVIQDLALDISSARLNRIPVTTTLGFDTTPKAEVVLTTDEKLSPETYSTLFSILQQQHYYKDLFTDSDLYYGSLQGMAEATGDQNTEFYTPEKNRQQQNYFLGDTSLEGIGAVLIARDKSIFVVSLIKQGPAERAGLKPKDQILAINGASTAGISIDKAVASIKGPAGTPVTLRIYREATGDTTDLTITREKIDIPSVEAEMLDGNIAYFKFNLFTADLIAEFEPLVKQYISAATQGVIIDMRDNIGGVTSAAAQLADNWLKDDDVIYVEKRLHRETTYVASGAKTMPSVPTVILMNEETASASEIFTQALRYHKQATVVGTKSYGKGTGQNLINFEDGSGLKYTTFEWLPPDRISINGTGVVPDITVPQGLVGDLQLDRAKQFIRYGF